MSNLNQKIAHEVHFQYTHITPTYMEQMHDMKTYPLECIFSRIEIASTAMQATISVDILHEPTKKSIKLFGTRNI
jgi:hypothetical protein